MKFLQVRANLSLYTFYKSMLHRISSLKTNYERCGFSRLKRMFQANINYSTYDQFVPMAKNQTIGNLAPEMIRYIVQKFPDRKGEMIKKFHKGLGLTAMFARSNWRRLQRERKVIAGLDELQPSEMTVFQTQMRNVLKSNISEILPEQSKIEFNFLDRGAFGHVFKLSILDKEGRRLMPDTALKIYHNIQNGIRPDIHGNYAEANITAFLKRVFGHNMGKSQYAKHYMSDMKAGYSLSEYLSWDGDYEFTFKDHAKFFGVHSMDALKNFIGGKIYDMGGFHKIWNFSDDKVTTRYFKKFLNNPKTAEELKVRYQKMADNPRTPHRQSIQNAIDLYEFGKFYKHDYIKEARYTWHLFYCNNNNI